MECRERVHLVYLRNSSSIIIIMAMVMDMATVTDMDTGISLGRRSISRGKKEAAVSQFRAYLE